MRSVLHTISLTCAIVTLTACSSFSSMTASDKVDYKKSGDVRGPNLALPPDLITAQADRRYVVQDGTATMSEYNQAVKKSSQTRSNVLTGIPGMKIERDGDRRWLVVDKSATELYPQVKDFWQENGFLLVIDSPSTGIMETDWAENRAKIPQDIIRRTLGRVLDSAYDSGERDKYRTRLEVQKPDVTEIYITHKGAIETPVKDSSGAMITTQWTVRPTDPELEAIFLTRLMERLGMTQDQARAQVAATATAPKTPRAKLVEEGPATRIEMSSSFDRAWRDVGLALDRSNFTVEDRDRSRGIYFVRYVNPKDLGDGRSWFGRTFGRSNDSDKKAKLYRVVVQARGENQVVILVQDSEGKPENTATGNQLLTTLDRQLIK
ncbi:MULTISPECIES: outer membrane protein assembly factor BamC [unclassified Polynucleobacter]|uniref:outer membrane protein assembly factor BamC n=1 Tax=unclassified Polynucleobacter TaxID=2640945 RepID=UPI002573F560|nr:MULTISPECIES: outer membrane protein assembly factor BamC [unclassified Polynucleobacter]BEI42608.1 outer membrane protein assembly factor BamC [Polynucleobacter sp. HIN10]BEI44362.1 outer membrane protein assembly factor BamC [Polynucleobacter sp. HIN11]